jgi:hypothetical protein
MNDRDKPEDAEIPGNSRGYTRIAYIRRIIIVYPLHILLWSLLAVLEMALVALAMQRAFERPLWFVLLTIISVVGGLTIIIWSTARLRRLDMHAAISAEVADVTLTNIALLIVALVCVFLWLGLFVSPI